MTQNNDTEFHSYVLRLDGRASRPRQEQTPHQPPCAASYYKCRLINTVVFHDFAAALSAGMNDHKAANDNNG